MDFVTRLKQYIDYTGLAVSQFADTAHIPRPTLSQILNGRNKKISNELIAKLHEGFPNLNIIWMLFGDGTMEVSQTDASSAENLALSDDSLFGADVVQDHEEMTPYRSAFHGDTSHSEVSNAYRQPSQSFTQPSQPTYRKQAGSSMEDAHTRINAPSDSIAAAGDKGQMHASLSLSPDNSKRVQSIMVFYSDNSFEIFTPSSPKQ